MRFGIMCGKGAKMKEYERLTERRETPLVMSQWGGTSKELKIYNRLAELEDKIERGELVENTVVTYVNMGRCNSKTLIDKALKYDELETKIENGTLMEINKPFIKKTKDGLYLICKAAVIWVEDFDTKAEAKKKLKELKELKGG